MKFIVAVDSRWGIGRNGDLLLSIPDDMQYYRATTRGKVVVMGYTTLLSLPGSKPAPGRLNLVLADIPGLRVPGAVVCGSMEQLHRMIGQFAPDDVFDVGGGSMYRQLMPYCTGAHITKMRFDGEADTYIPNLDEAPGWSVVTESSLSDYEGIGYSFVEYRNSAPLPLPAAQYPSSSMAAYFKKKEPLELPAPESDDAYSSGLNALLTAYFCPLKEGFSADDTARFLEEGQDISFEDYLRKKRLIATREDVANFVAANVPACETRCITVTKESITDG